MKNLDSLHTVLHEILDDFDSFCRSNDIQYSLAYGTVLGAVRHKGFIPWDDDLDVMMTRENYNKFLTLFKNNEKYTLQAEQKDYPLYFSKLRKNGTTFIENIKYRKKWRNIHQGVYIDIFPLDKVSTNKTESKLQTIFSNILISQMLFLRGYQTKNICKWIFMGCSAVFIPFKNFFFGYITKFNSQESFDYYTCFFGETKKVFINREWLENFEPIEFAGGGYKCIAQNYVQQYLERAYGNWKELPSLEQRESKIHAKIFDLHKSYEEFIK